MQPTPELAHVYVVENTLGLIKIGIALDVTKRLEKVQRDSGAKIIHRHYTIPLSHSVASHIEKALLTKFNYYRAKGHWIRNDIGFEVVCNALNSYFSSLPPVIESHRVQGEV